MTLTITEPPAATDYLRLLENWHATAEKWMHPVEGEPGLAYFGTGDSIHWAVQAQATAFVALAVMAVAPELDERKMGASRNAIRDRALQMLRYAFATHLSGRIPTISGQSWGHSWISVLALERMAHGIEALRPHLTGEDLSDLRRVMISESDFLLDGYSVVGAIDASTGKNKPESNIWCGSMLYRTAAFYPDVPHAEKYRHKAFELMLNGISIPSDAQSGKPYSGKALRDWHVGPNYTERYALNHHGYMNLGYMVVCLSNIAMFHYSCRDHGLDVPEEIYHHAGELWRLVKSLTFEDGRLWRIGGDTRVRYCYCQDYAVPTWMLASDLWGDQDAGKFLSGWIRLVGTEQKQNPDGGFLSGRLAGLAEVAPLYYCRLEGDRAASLSMAAWWSRRALPSGEKARPPLSLSAMNSWDDEFHGAAMVRGNRMASWVWKAAQSPMGTVAPSDRSDLVEWQWNLAGLVRGAGCSTNVEAGPWRIDHFPGGFVSQGSYIWEAHNNPTEGSKPEKTAQSRIVFAALPDDATVVVLQQARTLKPVYLNEVAGFHLNVPNDVYNGGERTYRINGEDHRMAGAGGSHAPKEEIIACGARIGIEGRMEIQALYGGDLTLRRPGKRLINLVSHIPLHFSGAGAHLYSDLICIPYCNVQTFHDRDVPLYDIGVVVGVDSTPAAILESEAASTERVIRISGADGRVYLLAANLGTQALNLKLPDEAGQADVLSGATPKASGSGWTVDVAPGDAALFRLRE